jgi:hypothetical protein
VDSCSSCSCSGSCSDGGITAVISGASFDPGLQLIVAILPVGNEWTLALEFPEE